MSLRLQASRLSHHFTPDCPILTLSHRCVWCIFKSINVNCKENISIRSIEPSVGVQKSRISFFVRNFSSARNSPKYSKRKNGDDPLVNEYLIQALLRKNGTNADSSKVRLVIDRGMENKPDIEVMSLAEAIKTSSQLGVDLVGINLKQDYPVVKAIDFNKMLYNESKKRSKGQSGKSGNTMDTKEFSFKAGIDDNDLQRKAKNMISYLKKGHSCKVSLSSNRRKLREDSNAIITTLGRISTIIGEDGKQQGAVRKNEFGNRGSILFQPNTKK